MPFVKGHSGNPKGRPTVGNTLGGPLVDMLRKELNKFDAQRRMTNIEVIVQALVKKAKNGEAIHIQTLLDRLYGKVLNTHDITTQGKSINKTCVIRIGEKDIPF